MPLVTLLVEDEWREVSDAVAKFKVVPNFPRSSWDWIGLYKVISVISISSEHLKMYKRTDTNIFIVHRLGLSTIKTMWVTFGPNKKSLIS